MGLTRHRRACTTLRRRYAAAATVSGAWATPTSRNFTRWAFWSCTMLLMPRRSSRRGLAWGAAILRGGDNISYEAAARDNLPRLSQAERLDSVRKLMPIIDSDA